MERLFKFYYVYQITNKINGSIYVGIHATDNINDGYMGSGLLIRRAIKKYGIENFVKIILFEGNSYQELLDKETEIVTTEFINREDTYNLREGGNGSAALIFEKELERRKKVSETNKKLKTGVPRSEETKRRIATTNTGKPSPKKGVSKYDLSVRFCIVCGKEFRPKVASVAKGCGKCCSRSCTGKLMNLAGVAHRN